MLAIAVPGSVRESSLKGAASVADNENAMNKEINSPDTRTGPDSPDIHICEELELVTAEIRVQS